MSRGIYNADKGANAPLTDIVGQSQAMQEVYGLVKKVAPTQATVLIIGETGTGKELIARAVHLLSKRNDGPYVRVNCGALNESLLESELFGHIKGAFTGAVENKTGRFEAAHGGTIFLDEISSMSPSFRLNFLEFCKKMNLKELAKAKPSKSIAEWLLQPISFWKTKSKLVVLETIFIIASMSFQFIFPH